MTDRIISLDAAQRVVHETIVNLCIADKNTCAGDYSAACLEALSALPAVDDSLQQAMLDTALKDG